MSTMMVIDSSSGDFEHDKDVSFPNLILIDRDSLSLSSSESEESDLLDQLLEDIIIFLMTFVNLGY